jgi:protein-tyrosine phosphatase
MQGTVDLHCHLLPGLDDGALDLDDAVAMAMQAEADGVAAICATPHIRCDHAVAIAELGARRNELAAALRAAGCRTRVLPGGEVAASMLDELDNRDLAGVALGGSQRWILLEPAPGPLDGQLQDAVEALHSRGFRALVAHPAPDRIERLVRLAARGALVQATAAYLTDKRTSIGMFALARAGVLHVLGTDSHSSRAGRPAELSAGLEALRHVEPIGAHLDWVAYTAPWAIVRGEEPVCPFTATCRNGWQSGAPAGEAPTGLVTMWRASSSTTPRPPVPSPCLRKFVDPAAAPSTSASLSGSPRAQAAAIAPIIASPQPSRKPYGNGRGTTSNGSPSLGRTKTGSSARVTATAWAPAACSRRAASSAR